MIPFGVCADVERDSLGSAVWPKLGIILENLVLQLKEPNFD
jgi:hypothetical protein